MNESHWEDLLRRWIAWITFGGFVLFALLIAIDLLASVDKGFWSKTAKEHLASVFGLPLAAVGSLTLVCALRTVAGDIKIKGLGFEFEGASGPIIMWVLCFLALTLAITKTWDLSESKPTDKSTVQATQP
jgi:hypothetical protein